MKVIQIDDLPGRAAALFEGRDHGAKVTFFISDFGPGDGPVLHRHPYEETFIIEEGSASFTVDDETLEAEAGQIVVVPAGAAHTFVNSGEGPLRQVSIHPSDHVVQERLG